MEPGLGLGKKTQTVIELATKAMKALKAKKTAEFYMPPKIVGELLSFFDDKEQSFLKDFLSVVTVKSPDVAKVTFPASIFYELVADIRDRSYRGLTLAQEELVKAFTNATELRLETQKDRQQAVGPHVKTLRERYRQATRTGFLDSVADLDLIVLAKELDGYLVSTDEGVMKWGRLFGVKEIEPSIFGKLLTEK